MSELTHDPYDTREPEDEPEIETNLSRACDRADENLVAIIADLCRELDARDAEISRLRASLEGLLDAVPYSDDWSPSRDIAQAALATPADAKEKGDADGNRVVVR